MISLRRDIMCFKDIYEKVEELKDCSIKELLELLSIRIIVFNNIEKEAIYMNYLDCPTIMIKNFDVLDCVLLHEIGHCLFDRTIHLANKRMNQNNANIFMCLMLLRNNIWECDYFDTYLINQGVIPKVAIRFNDSVQQRKIQIKYELIY